MSDEILCGNCGGLGDSFYARGPDNEPKYHLETCRPCRGTGFQSIKKFRLTPSKARAAMDKAIASINLQKKKE